MAHLFIVNNITFKYHLEYAFAGTGAANVSTNFIFDTSVNLQIQDEKRSVGMIADVSRIKRGDKIIFFVTGISRFYGIFEAASEFFLDPNDKGNYIADKLGKILTYRILIKPYKVYENGLSEYDCLDSLKHVKYPDEICWSLIYRKLGANRGCTMITEQEYEIFERKLSLNNNILYGTNFSFDSSSNKIITINNSNIYTGRQLQIVENMGNNMFTRYSNKKAFEHYLQYFTILNLKNNSKSKILANDSEVVWIGNEVMCSVGERRIDTLVIQNKNNVIDITLIELKDEKIKEDIIYQIKSYLIWLQDYIIPYYQRKNCIIRIHPTIISDGISNARNSTKEKLAVIENEVINYDWSQYNQKNVKIDKVRIFHFKLENNKVIVE